MQMASTNNVECPEWLDWFHGGLQFQIECALHPAQQAATDLESDIITSTAYFWQCALPCKHVEAGIAVQECM